MPKVGRKRDRMCSKEAHRVKVVLVAQQHSTLGWLVWLRQNIQLQSAGDPEQMQVTGAQTVRCHMPADTLTLWWLVGSSLSCPQVLWEVMLAMVSLIKHSLFSFVSLETSQTLRCWGRACVSNCWWKIWATAEMCFLLLRSVAFSQVSFEIHPLKPSSTPDTLSWVTPIPFFWIELLPWAQGGDSWLWAWDQSLQSWKQPKNSDFRSPEWWPASLLDALSLFSCLLWQMTHKQFLFFQEESEMVTNSCS